MALKLPEHNKLKAASPKNQTIGDFITWLEENGYEICKYANHGDYNPTNLSVQKWIAKYFDIDENQLEEEKRLILRQHRKHS